MNGRPWHPQCPPPQVLALPGQEERPCAYVDILVGAGQAAAVLLQVVPGILVEMGHLVEEVGLRLSDVKAMGSRKERPL